MDGLNGYHMVSSSTGLIEVHVESCPGVAEAEAGRLLTWPMKAKDVASVIQAQLDDPEFCWAGKRLSPDHFIVMPCAEAELLSN